MVSQLVGGPVVGSQWSQASPRMTAKSSHTHNLNVHSVKRQMRTMWGVYECVASDRCTRCPLSTPVAVVTNMLREGMEAKWQTQKPACLGLAASTWQVTQVNNLHHNNPEISCNFWKRPNKLNCFLRFLTVQILERSWSSHLLTKRRKAYFLRHWTVALILGSKM